MFLFFAVEKNEVLLIFNIFIYLFIYSSLFCFCLFFSLWSITVRDRIDKTQMMANYQELHLISCEHFLHFHVCFNHFHTCVEIPFLIITLFHSVKHVQYNFDNDKYCHISKGLMCVCICNFFFFLSLLVCCLSISFGWQPVHLKFIFHICNFSKQID